MKRLLGCVHLAIGLIALALAGLAIGGVLSGPVVNHGLTVEVVDLYQTPFSSLGRPYTRINLLREMPDGSGRLLVNDLNGSFYIIDGGQLQLYMDLDNEFPALKTAPGTSSGFVSFAVHPEFELNGLFYTVHSEVVGAIPPNLVPALTTSIQQHSVLTEWQASDPSANSFTGSSRELMRIAAPTPFHPLGEIAFKPGAQPGDADYGLLYLAGGDYGTGTTGQPDQIQRLDAPLGTLMRIDPLGGPFERDGIVFPYGIPPTNPFANDGDPATLGEIYAYGFRNGHRISWDSTTGTAFVSDVGQGNVEEVNILAPGANYGWPLREGSFALDVNVDRETVFPLPANDATFGFHYPAAQYDHEEGFAIAGGFVYRGTAIPALQGRFVFGDIVTGRIFYANVADLLAAEDGDPSTTAPVFELNLVHQGQNKSLLEIIRGALGDPNVGRTDLRFGMDQAGEIYITTKQDGFIRKLVSSSTNDYFDDFDRSELGPNWRVDNLSFGISGNELVETAPRAFAPAQMRWQGGSSGGGTNTPDQYAKIQIGSPLTATPAGFLLRGNAPAGPLAAHYEVHFKPSSGEWRWEYYNPLWQATLGSCAGDGTLAEQDWIGVTITGAGPDTEASLYRWDADPDGSGPPNPTVNWGAPDCVLESVTGPFADTGQFGGIRFYGSDPADSHADNWSFGSLTSIAAPEGNALRGGLLWDRWWVINGAAEPSGDHPLYPAAGQQQGSATFRCKECHGWDYKGVDGAYGSGSHFSGIRGVFGSTQTPAETFDLIKSDSVSNGHGFASYGLSDQDIEDLIQFLQVEVVDTDTFIDPSGQFIGDALQGQSDYVTGNCSYCHGGDGTAINFGTAQDPVWVGTVAAANPWEFLHKIRFGHPGTSMPSWLGSGGDNRGAADIGVYAQASLPIDCLNDLDCDDGGFCNGAETCNAGVCTTGTDPCSGAACDEGGDLCLASCSVDADCDDGAFCNGVETCNAGACTTGTDPCSGAACDEGGDLCLASCSVDADCDDGAFCNGAETCNAETCNAGAPTCLDLAHCDEGVDVCLECVADTECDDGGFCNGAETCNAGACTTGVLACVDLAHCDEGIDVCFECLTDTECDDGGFCNGAETCNAGACIVGAAPCTGGGCEEASQTCTAPGFAQYSDDFDRTGLGPDWVVDRLSFAIVDNELAETSPKTHAPAQMRWQGGGSGGSTGTPNQYGKTQIRNPLTTTPAGFIVRANAPTAPLAAHYEFHFKPSSRDWRWEYYNPLWQVTLGSCTGDGTLAALDWIGFTVTGSGPNTEVSLYRWDADPDAGGPPNPLVTWGPPDCVLQSATGPFADTGQYGGIRFYGSDRADSRADNWSFGGHGVRTFAPDDPFFSQLWGLHNEEQTGGTLDADIDALEAWALTTGSSNVVVAILDTGIDYTHEDLAANIWTNLNEIPGNGIDDDGNGYVDDTIGWDFYNDDNDPFDDGGHGSHLAGIIGAVGNNGIGVTGVNHAVRIMPLKISSGRQVGSIENAIAAIEYAIAMGAHVMSNSWAASAAWGEPGWDQPGFAPALQAAIEQANAAGILFVATAGNSGEDKDQLPLFPGAYDNDNVVNVAASDDTDGMMTNSSFGATSVDLAAPGVGILSTVPAVCRVYGPPPGGGTCDGSGYLVASGTSMSTAYVAGVAALIHARFPGISLPALKDRLLYSVDVLPDLVGITVSEGRVNAASAIEYDTVAPGVIGDLTVVSTTSTTATLGFTAPGDDGGVRRARAYDIRYATAPINAGNFASATPVASPPRPLPAGSSELIDIVGLDASTTYYFAVRAIDNVGNRGAVGGDAMGTTGL